MKRIKILFFVESLQKRIGGMEVHAQFFMQYFLKHPAFDIVAICTRDNVPPQMQSLKPDILFFNSGHWIEELRELREQFPRQLFVYRTGGNEFVKAPLEKNYHPVHSNRQQFWSDSINQTIDVIITNSLYTEQRLASQSITTQFHRVVGGVTARALVPRTKLPIPQLFCAARLVPYKGHERMIQVAAELKTRGLTFAFTLAGDGPLMASVQTSIDKYQLHDCVSLLGAQTQAEVCQWHRQADLYFQLSDDALTAVPGGDYIHSEGMGRSFLEAISAGVFVITNNVGALSEIIHPNRGILLETQNIDEIADSIQDLIESPPTDLMPTDEYDWQHVFSAYSDLFDQALS